jgi:Glucodextranase, domain B
MLNSVVFTLLPPYSTGGSAIVSYSASCTSPGRPTRVATALASAGTITVTNLTGGAIYRCTMTATNATTTSAESAFSSMLPIAPLGTPSSPVLPNYVPGINQATLRFIPGSAGDAPITSYTTICSAAGQSTVVITAAGTVEGSQTAMLITGLVGGVAYSCNVAANNSVGTGTTSGSITVIAASGPPLISITWPAANAAITPSTSGTPVINITLRGQDTPVGIVRIETFVDGVSVSYTTEQALPAVYVINTQAIWNSPTLGTHIITAKMTDANGTVYDSAPITIQVFAAPTVSIYAPYTFYLAPASIDVTAIATIAAASVGSTITKIEYLDITNVNPNPPPPTPPTPPTVIATLTTAPYALRWSGSEAGGTGSGLPTGTYLIQARATDSNGIVVTSAPVTFTVSAQSSIALPGSVGGGGVVGSGVNGSTVNDDTISFTGSFAAPPNSTVTVNGQLAAITASGQFAITNLPLQLGLNTLTILVSNAGGLLATQTITVTRGLSVKPFRFNVTPSQGSAPLLASIELKNLNNVPVSTIQVSCHNPGRDLALVSYSVANLANSTMSCIYNDPGVWTPWVLIKDPNGVIIYDEQRTVITVDGGNAITVVRAVYATLIDHLKVGNKAAALNQFFGHARGKYDEIFTALGTDLAAFAGQIGGVGLVTAGEDVGEVTLIRDVAGVKQAFSVKIMKGEDGVWRIESM